MSSVKSFWDDRARDPALDPAQVTHPDTWQRWLEIETVKPFLHTGGRVIDIGCGSGYATKKFAALVSSILGVDFSQGMIDRARQDGAVPPNASFETANVLGLAPASFGLFDTAVTMRCLINLPDWDTQQTALSNIASVVRPGGRYIFVEGCKDGRDRLNEARYDMGLQPMPAVWHNVDFERERTLAFLQRYFTVVEELGFGLYDLIARVVHPLLAAPEAPRYEAKINEIAARIASKRQGCNEISRVLFLVLERKGSNPET
jgi:SAM-dependent methyltransferase